MGIKWPPGKYLGNPLKLLEKIRVGLKIEGRSGNLKHTFLYFRPELYVFRRVKGKNCILHESKNVEKKRFNPPTRPEQSSFQCTLRSGMRLLPAWK